MLEMIVKAIKIILKITSIKYTVFKQHTFRVTGNAQSSSSCFHVMSWAQRCWELFPPKVISICGFLYYSDQQNLAAKMDLCILKGFLLLQVNIMKYISPCDYSIHT